MNKKLPLTPTEAKSLHAKHTAARDAMADVAEWTVRHYADKRTRKAVADVWRHFGETWICIEDILVDNGAERPSTGVVLGHSMRHLPKKMLPTPTIKEHLEMADKISVARANMTDIYCRLSQAMAMSARPVSAAERGHKLLGELRCQLDNRICDEYPSEQRIGSVYYGGDVVRNEIRERFGINPVSA